MYTSLYSSSNIFERVYYQQKQVNITYTDITLKEGAAYQFISP